MKKENKLYEISVYSLADVENTLGVFDEKGLGIIKEHLTEYYNVLVDQTKRGIKVNPSTVKEDLKCEFCKDNSSDLFDFFHEAVYFVGSIDDPYIYEIHKIGDSFLDDIFEETITEYKPIVVNGFLLDKELD